MIILHLIQQFSRVYKVVDRSKIVLKSWLSLYFIGILLSVVPKSSAETLFDYSKQVVKKSEPAVVSVQQADWQQFVAHHQDIEALLTPLKDSMTQDAVKHYVSGSNNTVWLHGNKASLQHWLKVFKAVDQPVQQIRIEVRLVAINQGALEQFGVNWTALGDGVQGQFSLGVSGDANLAFSIARYGSQLLDLELSALQSENMAEIISSPSLTTRNRKTAYIEQGVEIPFLENNANGGSSASFKKAVLSLEVTPSILNKDNVLLTLQITQDRPGQSVATAQGEALSIHTQRLETQVEVKQGATLVLGGVKHHTQQQRQDSIPWFYRLPVVGKLFQRQVQDSQQSELYVFVTPHLLD